MQGIFPLMKSTEQPVENYSIFIISLLPALEEDHLPIMSHIIMKITSLTIFESTPDSYLFKHTIRFLLEIIRMFKHFTKR